MKQNRIIVLVSTILALMLVCVSMTVRTLHNKKKPTVHRITSRHCWITFRYYLDRTGLKSLADRILDSAGRLKEFRIRYDDLILIHKQFTQNNYRDALKIIRGITFSPYQYNLRQPSIRLKYSKGVPYYEIKGQWDRRGDAFEYSYLFSVKVLRGTPGRHYARTIWQHDPLIRKRMQNRPNSPVSILDLKKNLEMEKGVLTVGPGKQFRDPQQAFDRVKKGETIRIYSGTYIRKEGYDLKFKPNVKVIGVGRVNLYADSYNTVLTIWGDSVLVSNIHAKHLNPPKDAIRCQANVLSLSGSDITIDNCELDGCGTVGISACNAKDLVFCNNYIHHNTICGIYLWMCKNIRIYGNRIIHNPKTITVEHSQGIQKWGNSF